MHKILFLYVRTVLLLELAIVSEMSALMVWPSSGIYLYEVLVPDYPSNKVSLF